jgi:hypothetical protein
MRSICFRFTVIFILTIAPAVWAKHDHADDFPSDVASVWFDTLYDVIKSEGTSPVAASRIYGITSVALYESIVSGTLNHQSLVGQLNDLDSLPGVKRNKKYHWPTSANAALADTIRGIFASLKPENLEMSTRWKHNSTRNMKKKLKRMSLEKR